MTTTFKETTALEIIYKEGLNSMGGNCAADLKDDNMTWFNANDLASMIKPYVPGANKHTASGIMSALLEKGFAADGGDDDWYLTDKGIDKAARICGELVN